MLLTTMDYVTGKELEPLGLVQGNVVKTKSIGKDFKALGRLFMGGEIEVYTELLKDARGIATERMVQEAKAMEADAIVAIRYATSNIAESASEVMAYGTAVKFV